MSGADPYRAPVADVADPPRATGAPARWRWAVVILSFLQAAMAMLWIWQAGGVADLLRNGEINAIAALPHMLSPIVLLIGAVRVARGRSATVVFAIAAALSAGALLVSWWRPLIAVTAVAIPLVAALVSRHSAVARRPG